MNVTKYVDAFCFFSFYVSSMGDKLFYIWEKEGTHQLYFIDLTKDSNLNNGEKICEEDFSKGSFTIDKYDEARNLLYVILDQDYKENTNLWKLGIGSGKLNQLTSFSNINGLTYNATHSFCWCFSKNKLDDGRFRNDVYEINLLTAEKTLLFNDSDNINYQIGFTPMAKIKGENAFVFGVEKRKQLENTNICKYSLDSKEWHYFLSQEIEKKGSPTLFDNNLSNDGFIMRSAHEGFNNFYFYNLANKDFKRITDLPMKYEGATLSHTENSDKKSINIITNENNHFALSTYELTGKKRSRILNSRISLFETEKNYWGIQSNSDSVIKLVQLNDEGKEIKKIALTSYPSSDLEYSNSTWISYPSFDGKEVKAILKMPKGELKGAAIQSFYGGRDIYDTRAQLYTELGIAFLSPAVRGSFGWGSEWEKIVDGNFGGDEILDVIWGAKYLEKKLCLPPAKIGVYGFSHGGYATLRAVTMSAKFNNIPNTHFNFSFAVSEAGFADLMPFYDDLESRDWTVSKFGLFDEKKYLERSPVNCVENLNTPILLINGKDDTRVPFSSIEKFIEILKKSDIKHEILVHEHRPHFSPDRETLLQELELEVNFLKRFI